MSDARQSAWETAMGMRGYAGSNAQAEDSKEAVTWAVRIEPKRGQENVRDKGGKLIRRREAGYIYVRAWSSTGAVAAAKANNVHTHYKVTGPARIATPQELGCKAKVEG